MILDKKLQLASNMSIGVAARDFDGCKTSTDKISVSALRNFGLGEPVFLCVTVKQDFTVSATSYIGMSLCAEHISDIATITLGGIAVAANGFTFHRLQPKLAFSGFVPGNFDSNTKNFVAGKKYILPISGLTAKYNNYPVLVAGYGGNYNSDRDVYFVFEEVNGADLSPASSVTNGTIDVDIVTLAEAGAGPGFNDQMCYPSTMKIS